MLSEKIYRRLIRPLEIFFFPNNHYIYSKKLYDHHNLSFSQEGEDCILARIFEGRQNGFYVDVGAHHPQRFSNTYRFYLKGWRGINIDAMPGSMEPFQELRPEDINIEAAISDSAQVLTYYIFNEPALNGFSVEVAADRDLSRWQLLEKRPIKTQTLAEILDNYLPPDQQIDFLNIDVEGLDYQVLLSNDWQKYRPQIVLVEELKTSLSELESDSKVTDFMRQNDYVLFAKTFNTSFYKIKS